MLTRTPANLYICCVSVLSTKLFKSAAIRGKEKIQNLTFSPNKSDALFIILEHV